MCRGHARSFDVGTAGEAARPSWLPAVDYFQTRHELLISLLPVAGSDDLDLL